ncbi:MAG: hypothetical protein AAF561_06650 [Planctomycetota bacterium]
MGRFVDDGIQFFETVERPGFSEDQNRVGCDRLCECSQRPRKPEIVAVEKGDVSSAGTPNAEVPGGARAGVVLLDKLNAVFKSLQDLNGRVRRSVIDGDRFIICVLLLEE